jgi:hypothetical protein
MVETSGMEHVNLTSVEVLVTHGVNTLRSALREADINAILEGPGYVRCQICRGRIPRSTCAARSMAAQRQEVSRGRHGSEFIAKSAGPDFSSCLTCAEHGKNGEHPQQPSTLLKRERRS